MVALAQKQALLFRQRKANQLPNLLCFLDWLFAKRNLIKELFYPLFAQDHEIARKIS